MSKDDEVPGGKVLPFRQKAIEAIILNDKGVVDLIETAYDDDDEYFILRHPDEDARPLALTPGIARALAFAMNHFALKHGWLPQQVCCHHVDDPVDPFYCDLARGHEGPHGKGL